MPRIQEIGLFVGQSVIVYSPPDQIRTHLPNVGANAYGQAVTIFTQLASVPLLISNWGADQYGLWLLLTALPAYLALADLGFSTAAGSDMTMSIARAAWEDACRQMITSRIARCAMPAAVLAMAVLWPHAALAHVGLHDAGDFTAGLMHPLSGLDHLLVMVGVGVVAAQIRGAAVWLVPALFLAAMTAGGLLGTFGVGLPFVEIVIAASVVATGVLIATNSALPIAVVILLTGVFAIFHGYVHGAEIPADATGAFYGAGFLAATALLHATGIGLGLSLTRASGVARLTQLGGGAIAIAGIVLLVRVT